MAPGPRVLEARVLEAQGPWARVLEAQGPRARVLEALAPGPGSLKPIGLEAPPRSQGETPLGSQGPPLGPRGGKKRFFISIFQKSVFFKSDFLKICS